MTNPYQTSQAESGADDRHHRKVPRLTRWHAGFIAVVMAVMSFWAVYWVVDWETTRGRVAPTNRLVWNGITIHTGPLAGVYYWDHGYNQPGLIDRTFKLFTSTHRRAHLVVVAIVLPTCLVLALPSTGFFRRPLRLHWRLMIHCAFLAGTCLWYFSAMISIAMLS